MHARILTALFCGFSVATAIAQDWPQILGPARNGVYADRQSLVRSPRAGHRSVWTREVGAGFAGPAVAAGRLILFHRVGGREIVDALDAATGKTDLDRRVSHRVP